MKRISHYILIFLILLSVTPSAFALEYNKIGGRPAFPREDNPRTDSIFVHTLEPGSLQDEGIRVINNTKEIKNILVYAADSVSSTDGGFACRQYSEEKNLVGSWIELEQTEITLEPNTNQIIPFVITVPENASVGEHNGCILIQEKPETGLDKEAGINLAIRTGLRVALTVPGEIIQSLQFTDFLVQKRKGGSFILSPIVFNNGNVSLDATIDVVTRSIFGRVKARHGGEFPVLRGEELRWSFEMKKPFWGGLYISRATVTYLEGHGELGQDIGSSKVLETKPKIFFSFPTIIASIIEILILFIVLIIVLNIFNRRKIGRWVRDHWVDYRVATGETLQRLSYEYQLPWKFVAKVNKIKPPYDIAGMIIKMPPASRRRKVTRKSASDTHQASARNKKL